LGYPEWASGANSASFFIFNFQACVAPFIIDVGAPASSLYVNSTGNVGLGTAPPAQKLHLVSGALPTTRFEQDDTSGLILYIWSLHANDLNFYIQDVSAPQFSAPFVLKAGAPSGSLYIEKNGPIGLGTAVPQGTCISLARPTRISSVASALT
jgi:hypothetical protein